MNSPAVVAVTVTGSDDGPVIDNSYTGTEGADAFYGLTGNTLVDGLGGNDKLYGDVYWVGNFSNIYHQWDENHIQITPVTIGDDIINAGAGNDIASGDVYRIDNNNSYLADAMIVTGNDVVNGDSENDTLTGDAFEMHNWSTQNSFTSTIIAGNDTVNGNDGNDIIYGDTQILNHSYNSAGSIASTILGDDLLNGGGWRHYIWRFQLCIP